MAERTQNDKKLEQVLTGIELISITGDPSILISGVQHDSRMVSPGDVFVALPGLKIDGRQFAADAAKRGAVAAVVEEPVDQGSLRAVIRVGNTRRALARIAANFWEHPSKNLALIGITGTNGKTTLTYLMEQVIQEAGGIPGVIGTIDIRYCGHRDDNPHTTPESSQLQGILHRMLRAGVTHVAMEVSSHALDLERVRDSHFKVAVFTNLSRDHLDYHGNLQNYAEAKSLLFSRELVESQSPEKMAVANCEDPHWKDVLHGWRGPILTFGRTEGADVYPIGEPAFALDGFTTRVKVPQGEVQLQCHLPGRHNLDNSLAAIAVALALGIPAELASRGIASCARVPGRLEPVDTTQKPAVFVDYAHTDHALVNVLQALRPLTAGRLIVVFGCGGDRDRGKRPLMGAAVARGADLAIVTSDNPRSEDPNQIIAAILPGLRGEGWKQVEPETLAEKKHGAFAVIADRKGAIDQSIQLAQPSDVVLIAGKGHEDYQIIGATKYPFDDREAAQKTLAARRKLEQA